MYHGEKRLCSEKAGVTCTILPQVLVHQPNIVDLRLGRSYNKGEGGSTMGWIALWRRNKSNGEGAAPVSPARMSMRDVYRVCRLHVRLSQRILPDAEGPLVVLERFLVVALEAERNQGRVVGGGSPRRRKECTTWPGPQRGRRQQATAERRRVRAKQRTGTPQPRYLQLSQCPDSAPQGLWCGW